MTSRPQWKIRFFQQEININKGSLSSFQHTKQVSLLQEKEVWNCSLERSFSRVSPLWRGFSYLSWGFCYYYLEVILSLIDIYLMEGAISGIPFFFYGWEMIIHHCGKRDPHCFVYVLCLSFSNHGYAHIIL